MSRAMLAKFTWPCVKVQNHGNFVVGNTKNVSADNKTPKFHLDQEANTASLQFSLMVDNDANIEKALYPGKRKKTIPDLLYWQ